MRSAAAKGQHWKLRTKQWLERQGFVVALMERVQTVPSSSGGFVFLKRDQLGCDLLAMNMLVTRLIQVRGGDTWRSQLAAAREEFAKYPIGPGCVQEIFGWTPRARAPEVITVAMGPQAAQHAVIVFGRRKRKPLPLFAARR